MEELAIQSWELDRGGRVSPEVAQHLQVQRAQLSEKQLNVKSGWDFLYHRLNKEDLDLSAVHLLTRRLQVLTSPLVGVRGGFCANSFCKELNTASFNFRISSKFLKPFRSVQGGVSLMMRSSFQVKRTLTVLQQDEGGVQ